MSALQKSSTAPLSTRDGVRDGNDSTGMQWPLRHLHVTRFGADSWALSAPLEVCGKSARKEMRTKPLTLQGPGAPAKANPMQDDGVRSCIHAPKRKGRWPRRVRGKKSGRGSRNRVALEAGSDVLKPVRVEGGRSRKIIVDQFLRIRSGRTGVVSRCKRNGEECLDMESLISFLCRCGRIF